MVKESMLARGERIVFSAHSHWKNLIGPVLVLLLAGAAVAVGLLVVVPDPATQAWQRWAIVVVAAALTLVFAVWPFLNWLASTDTLTTRRLISRRGVLSREGREIPIDRVQSVSYRRTLLERMLGCGTLILETAAGQPLLLPDVPDVERVHVTITELLFRDEDDSDE